MQFYCDPEREQDPHALPDAETFQIVAGATGDATLWVDDEGNSLEPGWYWWAVFPGCLPDGPPFGAFDTEELAIADARESVGAA